MELTSNRIPIIIMFNKNKEIMIRRLINLNLILFVAFAISIIYSCGGKGKAIKTIEGDPELLYKEGLVRFNKGDYSEALKKFEQLKTSFPDSQPFTTLAELKIGDCHFQMKEYVEAISAYEEFKKIHPTHDDIPYVQFQIAMSYFNQMLSLDRDQTFTKKALSNFEYLINNYPPNIFTEKAKSKIEICRKRLIDHEIYIGNFYYKQGKFEAALQRFEGILKMFPQRSDEDRILFFMGKSYIGLKRLDKAREVFMRILNEYPRSQYYKEAKSLIEKGLLDQKEVSIKKAKDLKKEISSRYEDQEFFILKYEDEGRRTISLHEEILLSDKKPLSEKISMSKIDEPSNIPTKTKEEARIEINPDDEKKIALLPDTKKLSEAENLQADKTKEFEVSSIKGSGSPIEIVSDRIETKSKENLITFYGNVSARQRDIIIYADSIEAYLLNDGKGIERIVAAGNVRIQQGQRVANCDRAIFYNLDQKVILTGNPKIFEEDNLISGEEIIFYIEKNQIEIKGKKEKGKVKTRLKGK